MQILTVPEVATELRVSEMTVYRLVHDGHLRSIKAGVRRYVVSREDLDAFIRAGGVQEAAS